AWAGQRFAPPFQRAGAAPAWPDRGLRPAWPPPPRPCCPWCGGTARPAFRAALRWRASDQLYGGAGPAQKIGDCPPELAAVFVHLGFDALADAFGFAVVVRRGVDFSIRLGQIGLHMGVDGAQVAARL